jgi:hypothetical protein
MASQHGAVNKCCEEGRMFPVPVCYADFRSPISLDGGQWQVFWICCSLFVSSQPCPLLLILWVPHAGALFLSFCSILWISFSNFFLYFLMFCLLTTEITLHVFWDSVSFTPVSHCSCVFHSGKLMLLLSLLATALCPNSLVCILGSICLLLKLLPSHQQPPW